MNAIVGKRVWWLLDPCTRRPVRVLTPDEAGAAKRAGLETTWVRFGFALGGSHD